MRVICFHNPDEENGYLSNWYPSPFTYRGTEYSSLEQYMMHQKAVAFGDGVTAEKILATDDVAKVKALGREVGPLQFEGTQSRKNNFSGRLGLHRDGRALRSDGSEFDGNILVLPVFPDEDIAGLGRLDCCIELFDRLDKCIDDPRSRRLGRRTGVAVYRQGILAPCGQQEYKDACLNKRMYQHHSTLDQ